MIDFVLILKLIWGPKSIQNEVGNRVGKVIGKRRAKEGPTGANMGARWGRVGLKIEEDMGSKSSMEKRSEKKG